MTRVNISLYIYCNHPYVCLTTCKSHSSIMNTTYKIHYYIIGNLQIKSYTVIPTYRFFSRKTSKRPGRHLTNLPQFYTATNQIAALASRLHSFSVSFHTSQYSPLLTISLLFLYTLSLDDYYQSWEPLFSCLRTTAIYGILMLESHHYI